MLRTGHVDRSHGRKRRTPGWRMLRANAPGQAHWHRREFCNPLLLRLAVSEKVLNVLFVCTANSARSILAEGLMSHLGRGRYQAFSAGSQPQGTVNPLALTTLRAKFARCGLVSRSVPTGACPIRPRLKGRLKSRRKPS